MRALLADAAAFVAGSLLVLAFAPFGFFWLPLPLLALLLWLWHQVSPYRAAWRGLLFGLGLYGCGISWVYISLFNYGNAPAPFAASVTLLLIFYLALYPAVTGYLLTRFWPRPGAVKWLLATPALWVLLEWVRSWLLSGFPWLSLGYSQTDSWLGFAAPVMGVFGISGLLVFAAGLLLLAVYRSGWQRPFWLAALISLWLTVWPLGLVQWVHSGGEPIRVSLIQGNIEQKQKWLPETLGRTLALYAEQSVQVAQESDVIIWPETAIPLFYDNLDQGFKVALEEQARRSKTDYLIGAPNGSWETRVFHNGVVAVGNQPGFYQKRRLLPFGEYLPLRFIFNLFHSYVDIPMADFTSGSVEQSLLQAGGYPVGVSICFEAAFGSEIRRSFPAAAWLVNVSNDGWFGDSLAPWQHLQIARMRAMEARRYLARATNTGVSALINPHGRIIAQGRQFTVMSVQGQVQPLNGITPTIRFGDTPILLLAALILVAVWPWRRAQQKFIDKIDLPSTDDYR